MAREAARRGDAGASRASVDEARRYLADLPAVTIEQRVQVRQAEAQLLRDAGDNAGGLRGARRRRSTEHPDQPDLLYDTAMVAEKLDKLDDAEAQPARLIELKPDNAQALNALGYTLVDRTPRTSEGLALIETRATSSRPTIRSSSTAWAGRIFRLGKLDDAETYLRRALTQRPDAEIAAHLGEVLWAKGERDARAGSLAVAAEDDARQRGAARDGAPARARERAAR